MFRKYRYVLFSLEWKSGFKPSKFHVIENLLLMWSIVTVIKNKILSSFSHICAHSYTTKKMKIFLPLLILVFYLGKSDFYYIWEQQNRNKFLFLKHKLFIFVLKLGLWFVVSKLGPSLFFTCIYLNLVFPGLHSVGDIPSKHFCIKECPNGIQRHLKYSTRNTVLSTR